MKRWNTESAIAKLGESAYNALVMTNQVNGVEKRILHYSYNLSAEEGSQFLFNEDSYESLTSSQVFGTQRITRRAFSKEEKETNHDFDKGKLRRNSIGHLPSNKEAVNGSANPKAPNPLIYFGGAMQAGLVHEKSTADFSKKAPEDRVTQNNGSRGNHSRKYGLGERTNISLMGHKLRKKAVCDSTDNSHYQRQFLRVLNKRF